MTVHSPILERVINPGQGDLPIEAAKQLLQFDFTEADRSRYLELAGKAQDGTLSTEERAELEEYLEVDDLLMMLQAKARASLSHGTSAA